MSPVGGGDGQGFGSQVPAPRLVPPSAVHSSAVSSSHSAPSSSETQQAISGAGGGGGGQGFGSQATAPRLTPCAAVHSSGVVASHSAPFSSSLGTQQAISLVVPVVSRFVTCPAAHPPGAPRRLTPKSAAIAHPVCLIIRPSCAFMVVSPLSCLSRRLSMHQTDAVASVARAREGATPTRPATAFDRTA